jgi:hypothetical protein
MDESQLRQQARLQEIQAKKARLAELKRTRELKDQEIRRARLSAADRPDVGDTLKLCDEFNVDRYFNPHQAEPNEQTNSRHSLIP